MQKIGFSCTTLNGTGKQGILPKDDQGYYTTVVGGLSVFNSSGDFYPYEAAKELFTSSSALMRRVKTGCLKGEYGHPKMTPGMSMEQFAQRVMTIDEKQTCVHFSEIWLDFDKVKDQAGKPIIAMMAKITPSGPFGPALEKSLNNPKEEVCFSIRAFTEDVRIGGIKHRQLREVVSYDLVLEGGIYSAKKFLSPTLESFNEKEFTKDELLTAVTPAKNEAGIAMESSIISAEGLFKTLGWEFTPGNKPSFLNW